MEATLSVWGVRGSLPAADRNFMEYGGNTSCFSLQYGDGILCFDAGSGLINMSSQISGFQRLDILISHIHIDHILGLYNLSSFAIPEIHLYGEAHQGVSFKSQLERIIGKPYWPVGLSNLPVQVYIHEIVSGEQYCLPRTGCDGIRIETMRGCHPNGSLLYRAEFDRISITYALDCEMNPPMFDRLKRFSQGSDLLIWDASYIETDKHPGWGHSTWAEGLELGRSAGVKQILMTHYSREYTDTFLQKQEQIARQRDSLCRFAREGMVICL